MSVGWKRVTFVKSVNASSTSEIHIGTVEYSMILIDELFLEYIINIKVWMCFLVKPCSAGHHNDLCCIGRRVDV